MAQGIENQVTDDRPVAGAGKPVRGAPVLQGILNRAMAGLDFLEGRLDLAATSVATRASAFPERNVPASRYHRVAVELGPGVLMEYARWGNYFGSPGQFGLGDWVAERDRLLEDFFPIRSGVLVQ